MDLTVLEFIKVRLYLKTQKWLDSWDKTMVLGFLLVKQRNAYIFTLRSVLDLLLTHL